MYQYCTRICESRKTTHINILHVNRRAVTSSPLRCEEGIRTRVLDLCWCSVNILIYLLHRTPALIMMQDIVPGETVAIWSSQPTHPLTPQTQPTSPFLWGAFGGGDRGKSSELSPSTITGSRLCSVSSPPSSFLPHCCTYEQRCTRACFCTVAEHSALLARHPDHFFFIEYKEPFRSLCIHFTPKNPNEVGNKVSSYPLPFGTVGHGRGFACRYSWCA